MAKTQSGGISWLPSTRLPLGRSAWLCLTKVKPIALCAILLLAFTLSYTLETATATLLQFYSVCFQKVITRVNQIVQNHWFSTVVIILLARDFQYGFQ